MISGAVLRRFARAAALFFASCTVALAAGLPHLVSVGTVKSAWFGPAPDTLVLSTNEGAVLEAASSGKLRTLVPAVPDGNVLAASGSAHAVVLGLWKAKACSPYVACAWLVDTSSGKVTKLQSNVNGAWFAPDGHTLFVTSLDRSPSARDLASGSVRALALPKGYSTLVGTGASGPDGATLFAANGNELALVDASTGKVLHHYVGPSGVRYWSAAESPDGAYVAAGTAHGALTVWRIGQSQTAFHQRLIKGDAAGVFKVGWASDGSSIYLASYHAAVRYSLQDGSTTIEQTPGGLFDLDPSTGRYLAAGKDGIALASFDGGTQRLIAPGRSGRILALGFSSIHPDRLLTITSAGLQVWDPAKYGFDTPHVLWTWKNFAPITAAGIGYAGVPMIVGSEESLVDVGGNIDWQSQPPVVRTFTADHLLPNKDLPSTVSTRVIRAVSFVPRTAKLPSATGDIMAVGGTVEGGVGGLFLLSRGYGPSGSWHRLLKGTTNASYPFALATVMVPGKPYVTRFAYARGSGVHLFTVGSLTDPPKAVRVLKSQAKEVTAVFFPDDPAAVVTVNSDATAVLWNGNTGWVQSRVKLAHAYTQVASVGRLAALIDGSHLAVWNFKTGKRLASFTEPLGGITSLALRVDRPDNELYVYAGLGGGAVHAWTVSTANP